MSMPAFAPRQRCWRVLGATVSEVSMPWHPIGIPIWAAIALEGTLHSMFQSACRATLRASIRFRLRPARALHDRANELPDTVKIGMLLGAYTDKYYQGYFYFKAQNLRRPTACGVRQGARRE